MSGLQDIPLADPEGLSVEGPEVAAAPKSNSLKRFFKISKKPLMRDQAEDDDENSSQDNKELGKSNTISRFFTRMKGANNKDTQDPSSSVVEPVEHDKPLPNAKPTIKTSISSYWKVLFNRQKSQRQNAAFGESTANKVDNESEEVHELQPVGQDPDTDTQPTVKDEQDEMERGTGPEPPNPKPTKSVANKASGQEILSALEGDQLSTNDHENAASI
ncbi:uncharacterized protein LOC6727472 [Drosophila simulans]|uniref:GD20122 n=1 Tax=Drosophila simulans TaxID=7240 RepID=B4QTF3_DROSI|nr:uncharacterized protein LOC6727472 [Drosophila simulans]EDX12355.1 GD20122 [Drosophila simulans]KMZ02678.1 uncharacterized protein Dsimw501_GD20122 [Drosophila simulans]